MNFERHWVSVPPSIWDNTNAWSYNAGGVVGAPIPGRDDTAFFDLPGKGLCTFSSPVTVSSFQVYPGYDGTISQGNQPFTIYSGGFYKGRFLGGGSDVTSYGTLTIANAFVFRSTDSTLHLRGDSSVPASFLNNNGTVALYAGAKLTCFDATFANLQILDSTNGPTARIDGTCLVGQLYLTGGNLDGFPTTRLRVSGDLYTESGFGSWGSQNDCQILMDASGSQTIHTEGGIIPGLYVDKTNTNPVHCYGPSDVYVSGDFTLHDGTFYTHGRNIQVGQ